MYDSNQLLKDAFDPIVSLHSKNLVIEYQADDGRTWVLSGGHT